MLASGQFEFSRDDFKLDALSAAALAVIKNVSPQAVIASLQAPDFWRQLAAELPALALQLVHLDVAQVLIAAWKTHDKLKKYGKAPLVTDEKQATVALATHHIKATLSPHLAIEVNHEPQGKVRFEFELDLAVNGGNLRIQKGRILSLEAASLGLSGTLKCEGVLVAEKKSHEVAWPAEVSFGSGIVIEG